VTALAKRNGNTSPFQDALAAVNAQDYATALRLIDRLWRQGQRAPDVLAVYMSLLLRQGYPQVAWRVCSRYSNDPLPPRLAGWQIEAARQLGKLAAGRAVLEATLAHFAIGDQVPFRRAALDLAQQAGLAGWIGITPDLRLTGAFCDTGDAATVVHVHTAAGQMVATLDQATSASREAALAGIAFVPGMGVTVKGDRPLAGADLRIPPHYGLVFRPEVTAKAVTGTIGLAWSDTAPDLYRRVSDGLVPVDLVPCEDSPLWTFTVPIRLGDRFRSGAIDLHARLPDGQIVALPGSPFPAARIKPRRDGSLLQRLGFGRRAAGGGVRPAAIVIPVYDDAEKTELCIASVLATTAADVPLVIVNDASPNPLIADYLRTLDDIARVRVITLEHNQGFPAAVNIGMRSVSDHDIVILNADTVVFAGWLERLVGHAERDDLVGTVTPFTNAGSIASYPGGVESACDRAHAEQLDRLAARINAGQAVEIPTGVGFCMYIRRDCLTQTGEFDAALFASGYGEENDFCLRARRDGWRHVLATDVFVHHANGASFGPRKASLMARNQSLLDLRYPEYPAEIAAFHDADPLAPFRRALDMARLQDEAAEHVLLVSFDGFGGVVRHVEERAAALSNLGYAPLFVLGGDGGRITLKSPDQACRDLVFAGDADIAVLCDFLRSLTIPAIELHHLLNVPTQVVAALSELNAGIDIFIHDFSWLCTRISLLDGDGKFCGLPGISACRECFARWGAMDGIALPIDDLRAQSARLFGLARHIFIPSEDARQRYARIFPGVRFELRPWEVVPSVLMPTNRTPNPVRKIAVIGGIGDHKGYQVIVDCARHAALRSLNLEFVIIGYTKEDGAEDSDSAVLAQADNVFVTGYYDDEDLPYLIAREAPDAFLFPSIIPETWCYALTAALQTGLPVVAFDLGAIAERLLADYPLIRLLPVDARPAQVNEALLAVCDQASAAPAPKRALSQGGVWDSIRFVQQDWLPVQDKPNPISASADLLTLARGLYLFTVPRTGRTDTDGANRFVPALLVCPAPGNTEDDFELIKATAGQNQWLTREGDSIVVKIKSDVASVMVMILTVPGMPPLGIEVAKLDGESLISTPPGAPPAAAPAPQAPPVAAGRKRKDAAIAAPAQPAEPKNELACQIVAHLANFGDTIFATRDWVVAPDGKSHIEAFSIMPLVNTAPDGLEYMALSDSGLETGWLDHGRMCGTRRVAAALLAFAIRPKYGPSTKRFNCEYFGRFQSGVTIGPLYNGAVCRSNKPGDRLVGMWVRVIETSPAEVVIEGQQASN